LALKNAKISEELEEDSTERGRKPRTDAASVEDDAAVTEKN
jgi:hypothetical protein